MPPAPSTPRGPSDAPPGGAASGRALKDLSPADRVGEFERAERAVSEGGLVIASCESAVLACARADAAAGIEALRALMRRGPASRVPRQAVWLAPGMGRVTEVFTRVGAGTPARMLVGRLAPGPAVFVLPLGDDRLEAARLLLRVGPESVDDGGALAFRVPARSAAAQLAQQSPGTLACVEVIDPAGRLVEDAWAGAGAVRGQGLEVAAVLDDGPFPSRHGATVVRLDPALGPTVLRPGAYEDRYVRKQQELNVLFVCTGNTCRSPMAEAIATGMAEGQSPREARRKGKGAEKASPVAPAVVPTPMPMPMRFGSAGVGAASGAPAASEATAAVRSLGFTLARHRSRGLTRKLIEEADVIYAMSRSHLDAVVALDPAAVEKAALLDPEGGDVPDPVGSPQAVYTQTARRLADLIAHRLKELRS